MPVDSCQCEDIHERLVFRAQCGHGGHVQHELDAVIFGAFPGSEEPRLWEVAGVPSNVCDSEVQRSAGVEWHGLVRLALVDQFFEVSCNVD